MTRDGLTVKVEGRPVAPVVNVVNKETITLLEKLTAAEPRGRFNTEEPGSPRARRRRRRVDTALRTTHNAETAAIAETVWVKANGR